MKKRRQAKTAPTIIPTIAIKGNSEVVAVPEGGVVVKGVGDDGKGVAIKFNNKIASQ